MSAWPDLEGFLTTDPLDVDCDVVAAVLHVYVEQVLAGADVATTMPGVAAHLRVCSPCIDDYEGLLALLADEQA
ncbi:hypothetical protein EV189_3759 [Motilibacter rhizosphaerae]|uniref:Uncharacterized protein n=1 Tax=Motilibacter rhizosphaerae TaxID=598652 RepID=A0A4Q7NAI8_9ACTN|nr:hypothetical protein [Motilibacter rhizosphaerae]RZS79405.1 hypothetical protein EV189_3759 [Motilibacter rhizosphaerae]